MFTFIITSNRGYDQHLLLTMHFCDGMIQQILFFPFLVQDDDPAPFPLLVKLSMLNSASP